VLKQGEKLALSGISRHSPILGQSVGHIAPHTWGSSPQMRHLKRSTNFPSIFAPKGTMTRSRLERPTLGSIGIASLAPSPAIVWPCVWAATPVMDGVGLDYCTNVAWCTRCTKWSVQLMEVLLGQWSHLRRWVLIIALVTTRDHNFETQWVYSLDQTDARQRRTILSNDNVGIGVPPDL